MKSKDQVYLEYLQELATSKNDVEAQYTLGEMYYFGEGVQKTFEGASKWYRLAADQGHAGAQYKLGSMYCGGEGVKQSYEEALKWYRLAADRGYVEAQFKLSLMYYYGEGVEQSYEEAANWYRLAADCGHFEAQFSLGEMYYYGEGVEQSYEEALKWYKLAADQGEFNSQYKLGQMYAYGIGVEKSLNEAIKYLTMTSQDDSSSSVKQKLLEELLNKNETNGESIEIISSSADNVTPADGRSVSTDQSYRKQVKPNPGSAADHHNRELLNSWRISESELLKAQIDLAEVDAIMYPDGLDRSAENVLQNDDFDETDASLVELIGDDAVGYLRLCLSSRDDALTYINSKGLDLDLVEEKINDASVRVFGDYLIDNGVLNEDLTDELEDVLND